MKPTSIIFLILAAILIVAGIILCIIGGAIAGADDVEILCEYTDEEGNDITDHSLAEYSLTSINIDFENANVNIIGQSAESKIEFKNINFAKYDFTINKKKLSLESINPLDVSSIIKFRENEGGFDGLRHYLHLGKYKDDVSEVTIYLTADQMIDDINISVKNGDIKITKMGNSPTYNLTAKNGNVVFESTTTESSIKADVEKGNFTFNRSNAFSIDLIVNNGNGKFITDRQFNYTCVCEAGNIFLDEENAGDTAPGVYPEIKVEEGQEEVIVPCMVNGKITSGDLVIDTVE